MMAACRATDIPQEPLPISRGTRRLPCLALLTPPLLILGILSLVVLCAQPAHADVGWQPGFGYPRPGADARVRCTLVYDSDLIVGGEFLSIGNCPIPFIARWDGSDWHPLGSGTNGYVSVTLKKEPSFNPQGISVLFDGHPIDYDIDSTNQSWILYFTYAHSVHNIVVSFNADEILEPTFPSSPDETPEPTPKGILSNQFEGFLIMVIIVAVCIVGAGLIVYFKKRKR